MRSHDNGFFIAIASFYNSGFGFAVVESNLTEVKEDAIREESLGISKFACGRISRRRSLQRKSALSGKLMLY